MLSLRRRVQIKQWLRTFGAEYGGSLRRLFSVFGFGGLATATIVVMIMIRWGAGFGEAHDELVVRFAEFYAALAVLLAWSIVNLFVAVIGANQRLRALGSWSGNRFVYCERQLATTVFVSAGDDTRAHKFKIRGAPRKSFVRYRIELDPDNPYWEVFLIGTLPPDFLSRRNPSWRVVDKSGGTRIGERGELTLITNPTRDDADSVTARVWVDSWEVGPAAIAEHVIGTPANP